MKRQLEAVVGSLPAPGLSEQTPPLPLPGCLEPPTFWRLDWQRAGDGADLAEEASSAHRGLQGKARFTAISKD